MRRPPACSQGWRRWRACSGNACPMASAQDPRTVSPASPQGHDITQAGSRAADVPEAQPAIRRSARGTQGDPRGHRLVQHHSLAERGPGSIGDGGGGRDQASGLAIDTGVIRRIEPGVGHQTGGTLRRDGGIGSGGLEPQAAETDHCHHDAGDRDGERGAESRAHRGARARLMVPADQPSSRSVARVSRRSSSRSMVSRHE